MLGRGHLALLALPWVACTGTPSARVPSTATATRDDAAIPCDGESTVEVRDHDVDLDLTLAPPALEGRGAVRVVARTLTRVVMLDARRLRVREVHDGVRPLAFRQQDDHLCVQLAQPLAEADTRTLYFAWSAQTDSQMPRFAPDVVWAGYQTSAWMPTRQDPAQRATLRMRIRAPRDLTVVASGKASGRRALPDGRAEHAFVLDQPVPPFLLALAAGRFEVAERQVDHVALRTLGASREQLEPAQALAQELLRTMSQLFDAPYPSSAYTQVLVPGEAAQEAAGMALLSASALDDLRADPHDDWLFTHELAHQWFAVMVPCAGFADFWLNEGFATFMVGVVKERREGRAAYEAERARWLARSADVHAQGRDAPVARPASSPAMREDELPPRGVTYMRGALVLDLLRRTLGDDVFWRGIRAYLRAQAGAPTRTDDLRRALERASGRDLSALFATWVYAPAWDF